MFEVQAASCRDQNPIKGLEDCCHYSLKIKSTHQVRSALAYRCVMCNEFAVISEWQQANGVTEFIYHCKACDVRELLEVLLLCLLQE